MRKVILKMDLSTDGFVATSDRNVRFIFPYFDDDFTEAVLSILWEADIHIMGSGSYRDQAAYWPGSDEVFAHPMNSIPKVVFSQTLQEANWSDSEIASGNIVEEIERLKAQPGNIILAHGGIRFARSLIHYNLIDEFRLIFHPVALGNGFPLFSELSSPLKLSLEKSQPFRSGSILNYYKPIN